MMNNNMSVLFLLGVLVVAAVLFAIIIVTRRVPKSLDQKKYQSDWLTIEQSVGRDVGSCQLAVMNADKLLDRALKERGFKGQTMGERMVSAGRVFTKRDSVWAAHKLRNRLAHEDNVHLSESLTKKALSSFKYGLKDLGAL